MSNIFDLESGVRPRVIKVTPEGRKILNKLAADQEVEWAAAEGLTDEEKAKILLKQLDAYTSTLFALDSTSTPTPKSSTEDLGTVIDW